MGDTLVTGSTAQMMTNVPLELTLAVQMPHAPTLLVVLHALVTLDILEMEPTALILTNALPELIAVTLKLTAPTLMVHTHAPVKLDTQEMESTTALTLMNAPLPLMPVFPTLLALTLKEVTLVHVTVDSSVMEQP